MRPLVAWLVLILASFTALAQSPKAADRSALFAQLEKTRYVVEGAGAPKSTLYVFFDANCYYCNLTWRALQPYEKVGLQVRWIPVAYQKDSSAGMAAAILAASDPAAALRENETRYRPENYDGGIKPLPKVASDVQRALDDQLRLMQAFGAKGTPALVWKDRAGRIAYRNAVPKLSELPRITGLPAQKNEDPALKEFR